MRIAARLSSALLLSTAVLPRSAFFAAAAKHPYSRSMSTQPPKDDTTISLYSVNTPNGLKVNIALEELIASGSPVTYSFHKIDFSTNEQKKPWFLSLNPNGRIPAIVDNARGGFNVWESAAILLYLEKHYDPHGVLGFKDEDEESEKLMWTMFQMGGVGPMQGQAGHFVSAAPGNGVKDVYAAKRYIDETKRLYSVYETRLADGREYLVGAGKGKFSTADVVTFTWVRAHPFSLGIPSLKEAGFPLLDAYVKRVEARPAVAKAIQGDMISQLKDKPDWEEITKKKIEWIYADESKPKDEL